MEQNNKPIEIFDSKHPDYPQWKSGDMVNKEFIPAVILLISIIVIFIYVIGRWG